MKPLQGCKRIELGFPGHYNATAHICRRVSDGNGCIHCVDLTGPLVEKLRESREPTEQAKRRVRGECRCRAVRRDVERILLAPSPDRTSRLVGDAPHSRTIRQQELEGCECLSLLEGAAVRGTTTDDEPAELVVFQERLRARDGG